MGRLLRNWALFILLACTQTAAFAAASVELQTNAAILQRINQGPNLNAAFGLNQQEAFAVVRSQVGQRTTYTHYQQTYRGVPVWGQRLVVGRNSQGSATFAHGRLVRDIAQDVSSVTPSLDRAEILAAMKANAQQRAPDAGTLVFSNETSELVIFIQSRRAALAYVVSFYADSHDGGHPTRPTFLVDAHSGTVLYEYEGLAHQVEAIGEGPGGNVKTGYYTYGPNNSYNATTFPKLAVDVDASGLVCTMEHPNVRTVDLNHGSTGSAPYVFENGCPTNERQAINGAYSPLNDAHYFGGVVFDMYNEWVGVAPLQNQLQMRVHYGNDYENAFWNGTSMTFGDGHTKFYPLVSLDVSAHEVSHGFTEQHSGLIYSEMSGGINESFSDIAGEAAEQHSKGTNDFLVGADIFKATGALRYMADPTLDGLSIDHAANYTYGMDVHYSSGVFNKAFYLLATSGDVAASDTPWNVETAFKLFAHANRTTWTPSESFDSAYYGVLEAAVDLGYETRAIADAFAQVGVPAPPVCELVEPQLDNGITTDDFSAATGEWKCWTLDVAPDALTLEVVLRNTAKGRHRDAGDADLYIKYGAPPRVDPLAWPPVGDDDCGSYTTDSFEDCTVSHPLAGTWYLAVYAWQGYPSVSLTGTYVLDDGGEPPPSDNISLTVSKKKKHVSLNWSGAMTVEVSVLRIDNLDRQTERQTTNDGSYNDRGGQVGHQYQVCEWPGNAICSDWITVQ
jgi:vibriolysin